MGSLPRVLQDLLREVCLLFFRDNSGQAQSTSSLPSAAYPHVGFASLVAPLCYLFDDPSSLYSVFHVMHTRLWRDMDRIDHSFG